ncbi:hypothetical protein P280DRAFT_520281 [Massarina eburnea CBS 473.64]|uniref:Uncharacterized protein n=1 Tax=Massarina eburnea CBS 473.64 TaxID=1395130 RepID=A0A6A6RSC5_9PLEO|nr:hypothetical protein P280DRAFT_520281 [Massarina eburnea CBS 473.64]
MSRAGQSLLTKRFLKDLYADPGYGDNWFNSGKFNPLARNVRTHAVMSGNTHNCKTCTKKVMTKECWDNAHYVFCPCWEDHKEQRVRCAERYLLESGGCIKHPRVSNRPAQYLYTMAKGIELPDGVLDDDKKQVEEPRLDPKAQFQRDQEVLNERILNLEASGKAVTQEYTDKYWEGIRLNKEKLENELKIATKQAREAHRDDANGRSVRFASTKLQPGKSVYTRKKKGGSKNDSIPESAVENKRSYAPKSRHAIAKAPMERSVIQEEPEPAAPSADERITGLLGLVDKRERDREDKDKKKKRHLHR